MVGVDVNTGVVVMVFVSRTVTVETPAVIVVVLVARGVTVRTTVLVVAAVVVITLVGVNVLVIVDVGTDVCTTNEGVMVLKRKNTLVV